MKKTIKVTLLASYVLSFVSFITAEVFASNQKTNQIKMSADQLPPKEKKITELSGQLQISRSTSLYDFKDGSRKDGMDYILVPQISSHYGTFKAKLWFSQNLKDERAPETDWVDSTVSYSTPSIKWTWSQPYIILITPSLTTVVPTSQVSIKRDEYKFGLISAISFSISPDGIAPTQDAAWNLGISLTAGQNFHNYSTDINGKVLNKYSSNQSFILGYTYKKISLGLELVNKSRWSYQGNSKNSFVHSEELGYEINKNFSVAIGHSNEGSGLKANATDSNFELINEKASSVYGTLGVSF